MKVKLTKRAERRIEIVDGFWRNNRLKAPDLFKEELAVAEMRLSQEPYAGRVCVIGGKQVRRLLLPRTEQWVYYVVRAKQQLVVVQTVWALVVVEIRRSECEGSERTRGASSAPSQVLRATCGARGAKPAASGQPSHVVFAQLTS